jgi:hypothetical protein
MNADLLEHALRAWCRRRPFRRFLIEFNSGGQLAVVHPEAIRREGELFVNRSADGRYEVFPSENISRLLESPVSATT